MPVSAIDKELLKCFTQLDDPQKKSLLELIRTFLKGKQTTSDKRGHEEYTRELDEAMERVKKGAVTTLDALEKEMQGW